MSSMGGFSEGREEGEEGGEEGQERRETSSREELEGEGGGEGEREEEREEGGKLLLFSWIILATFMEFRREGLREVEEGAGREEGEGNERGINKKYYFYKRRK